MTKVCPTCGSVQHDFHSGHNSSDVVPLSVPSHLLPLVIDALACAVTESRMSRASESAQFLKEMTEKAKQLSPEISRYFSTYAWTSLMTRAESGRRLEISKKQERVWGKVEHWIEIVDGEGEPWPGVHRNKLPLKSEVFSDEELCGAVIRDLRDLLTQVAPLPE